MDLHLHRQKEIYDRKVHGIYYTERIITVGHRTFDDQTMPLTSQTNLERTNSVRSRDIFFLAKLLLCI